MADGNNFTSKIIEEFRANGGRAGAAFQCPDVILPDRTAARTGAARVGPLGYQPSPR